MQKRSSILKGFGVLQCYLWKIHLSGYCDGVHESNPDIFEKMYVLLIIWLFLSLFVADKVQFLSDEFSCSLIAQVVS